jgi:hypothetical protein
MITKKLLATTLSAIISYVAANGVLAASVQLAAKDLASPSKTLLANGLNGEGGKLASALSLSSRQKASLETALAEIRMKTPTKAEVNQDQYIEGQIKARMEAEKLLNTTLTATQRSLLNLLQQKSGVTSLLPALNNVKAVQSTDNCSDSATQELTVEYVEPQVITVYLEEPEVQEITVYLEEPDVQEITVYLTPLADKESTGLERGKAASAAVDRGKVTSTTSTSSSTDKTAAPAGAGAAVDRGKVTSTTSTSSSTDKTAAPAGAGAAVDRGKVTSTTSTSSSTDKTAAPADAGAAVDRGKVTSTTSTSSSTDKTAAPAGAGAAVDRGKVTSTTSTATTSGDKATASVGAADRSKAAATTGSASSAAEKLKTAASAGSASKAQAALQTAAKK